MCNVKSMVNAILIRDMPPEPDQIPRHVLGEQDESEGFLGEQAGVNAANAKKKTRSKVSHRRPSRVV